MLQRPDVLAAARDGVSDREPESWSTAASILLRIHGDVHVLEHRRDRSHAGAAWRDDDRRAGRRSPRVSSARAVPPGGGFWSGTRCLDRSAVGAGDGRPAAECAARALTVSPRRPRRRADGRQLADSQRATPRLRETSRSRSLGAEPVAPAAAARLRSGVGGDVWRRPAAHHRPPPVWCMPSPRAEFIESRAGPKVHRNAAGSGCDEAVAAVESAGEQWSRTLIAACPGAWRTCSSVEALATSRAGPRMY